MENITTGKLGGRFLKQARVTLAVLLGLLLILLVVSLVIRPGTAQGGLLEQSQRLPEFSYRQVDAWINSQPLTVAELRGKVVLLDIWTYACWNCYRSFPWLKQLEQDYARDGLQVIGIHSPEFKREHQRKNVVKKARQFGLQHPIMMDNQFKYWRALGNRYWPTFYLVDKQGNIRAKFVGETHPGSEQAEQIETVVKMLLAE